MTRLQCWTSVVKDVAKAEEFFKLLGYKTIMFLKFKEKVEKEIIEKQGFREPDDITMMLGGENQDSDECFVEIVKFDGGFGSHYQGAQANMVVIEVDDCEGMYEKLTAISGVRVIRPPTRYEEKVVEAGQDFFEKMGWRPVMAAFLEVDIGREDGKMQTIEIIQVKRD